MHPSPPLTPLLDGQVPDLAAYLGRGGGLGLARAKALAPERVIALVGDAGLRGRGGAGFPTARKWAAVASSACPTRYLVCNAAEGEPGSFKDRWLLRHNPYVVLEGMAIAAHALGAGVAFVAIKARFDTERARLEAALAELRAAALLDGLQIRIVAGPDDYLFGEEKAMLEVVEGRAPMPRILPPHQVGLFARPGSPNPTAVNNAETLANLPRIVADGPASFRGVGTDTSPGTMLFSVCGDVGSPGVVELPLGSPLRALVEEHGGGTASGRPVKAVLAGVSAGVVTPDLLDVPLTFEALRSAGSALGSGGFIVYDTATCMVEAAALYTAFLRDGSCGQCPACGQGTARVADALQLLDAGREPADVIKVLTDHSRRMTGGTRCGLPKGAAALVGSLVARYEEEFVGHGHAPCERHRALRLPTIALPDVVSTSPTSDGPAVGGPAGPPREMERAG